MADVMQRQKELREQSLKVQADQRKARDIHAQQVDMAKQDEFKRNNVQLSTGEWISNNEFNALNEDDQKRIIELGIKGFNNYYDKQEADFKTQNVQIGDGWLSRSAYESMSFEDQQRIKDLGIEGFNKYYEQKQADFERDNIKLQSDEWISKTEYNNLSPMWQSEIYSRGINGFQNWLKTAYPGAQGFIVIDDPAAGKIVYGKTDNPNIGIDAGGNNIWIGGRWPDAVKTYLQGVEIRGSEIISREQLTAEKLAALGKVEGIQAGIEKQPAIATIKTAGQALGESAMIKTADNQYIDRLAFDVLDTKYQEILKDKGLKAFEKEYAKDHVRLDDGTYITNDVWAHLSKEDQILANQKGYEAVFEKNTILLGSGERIEKESYNSLPPKMQEAAMKAGLEAINIGKLSPENQFKRMQEWDMIPQDAKFAGIDETGQVLIKGKEEDIPWHEKYLNTEMAKGVAIGMIPIAGTIYHWEKMQPWEKGLSIALDVATFIPFVGAVSAGVRAGGKLTAVVGRAVLAEAKAPITMITHLPSAVKSVASPARTLLSPKRIPVAAAELRSYIMKIPVNDIGSAKDAMQARDIITKAAIMGDTPAVEIAGKKIELAKVALQQKGEPLAVHSAPDLRAFLNGIEIKTNVEGLGLFVQSSLNTRLTKATAFGSGITPAPNVGVFELTGQKIRNVGKYSPDDIAKLDKPPIRKLDLADANDIPSVIAPQLQNYIRSNDGTIVGSFTEWLKKSGAKKPNDIDLNFSNPVKARNDIANIARNAGYDVRIESSAVMIKQNGKWGEIANVKGDRSSFFKEHGISEIPAKEIDGIKVIPLGEQYLRQGFGALSGFKQAKREKHMLKLAGEIENLAKEAGFTQKMPGALLIRDERVLNAMQPSGKLYRNTAEIEQTIPPKIKLDAPSQILITKDIEGNDLYLMVIGKPFTQAEITKFKLMGAVDTVRDIFRPAMTIDKKAIQGMDEINEIAQEARALESRIKAAEATNNIGEANKLKTELALLNNRSRSIARRIDIDYAGRTSIRSVMRSTDDFINRISYNDLARSKPVEFARTISDLPRAERNRILDDLDRTNRARINKEMERVSRTPRAESESRPIRVIEPDRIIRDTRVTQPERGIVRPSREKLPVRTTVPVRTTTSVSTRTPVPPKITSIITHIESKTKDKKQLTPEQINGAVAWRQGLFYRMHYPPFGANDKLVTREPIPSVKYHEGIGSAAKSAVTVYGELPQNVRLDMGIVDVHIDRSEKVGQPKLKFKADPKQKTTYYGKKDQSSIKTSR